jgi:hypothetical protein
MPLNFHQSWILDIFKTYLYDQSVFQICYFIPRTSFGIIIDNRLRCISYVIITALFIWCYHYSVVFLMLFLQRCLFDVIVTALFIWCYVTALFIWCYCYSVVYLMFFLQLCLSDVIVIELFIWCYRYSVVYLMFSLQRCLFLNNGGNLTLGCVDNLVRGT